TLRRHRHPLAALPALQFGRHGHAVRPQERRQVVRLPPAPPRRCLMPLQGPLVNPVRYCRRRHLTDARYALRAPIPLRLDQTHGTRNTIRTQNAQGGCGPDATPPGQYTLSCYATLFYRRASAQRLVASSTASTELRSALSRISHVPVNSWASRPPSPWTATITNLRSNASTICAPSSATELSGSSSSRHNAAARAAA